MSALDRLRRVAGAAASPGEGRVARPDGSAVSAARRWEHLALALLAPALGCILFAPPFDSPSGALVAGAGLVCGAGVGAASTRWRLSPLATLAAAAAVHVLLAPWILPDVASGLDAVRDVLSATVTVWRDSLTVPLPLSAFATMSVLPWLTGLVCGLVVTRLQLAGHVHLAGLAGLVLPVVAIAWGGQTTVHPAVLGSALVGATLLPWALRTQGGRHDQVVALLQDKDSGARDGWRRGAVGAVALIVAVGTVVSAALPATSTGRSVLRDYLAPPLDLTSYPTPLSQVRSLETDLATTTLMTVTGATQGTRIRVATLDSYDGLSTRLSQGSESGGRFERAGEGTPLLAQGQQPDGSVPEVTVTIEGYRLPWVPTVPDATTLAVSGPRAVAVSENLYYDRWAATGLTTAGLTAGDVLTQGVDPVSTPSDEELAKHALSDALVGPVENVPPAVQTLAESLAGGSGDTLAKIRALQQALRAGYYSDGTQSASAPGHGAARIAQMLSADALVGDDEQYATLMMLACRALGIPSRVAMGFDPALDGDPSTITGKDVSAWVEVPFDGVGWVPFTVTPDRQNVPSQQSTHEVSNPQPRVLQPPLPLQEPADLPPVYNDDRNDQSQNASATARVAVVVAVSLLVVLGPMALVVGLKALRRRRRQRRGDADARALGAWDEVLDRACDLGCSTEPGSTRRETALALDQHFPQAGVVELGDAVDAQVFSPEATSSYAVSRIWESAQAISRAMGRDRSRLRRLVARLSPRSLLRRTGARKPSRRSHSRITTRRRSAS